MEVEEYGSWSIGLNTGLLAPNWAILGMNLSGTCADLGPACTTCLQLERDIGPTWAQCEATVAQVEPNTKIE